MLLSVFAVCIIRSGVFGGSLVLYAASCHNHTAQRALWEIVDLLPFVFSLHRTCWLTKSHTVRHCTHRSLGDAFASSCVEAILKLHPQNPCISMLQCSPTPRQCRHGNTGPLKGTLCSVDPVHKIAWTWWEMMLLCIWWQKNNLFSLFVVGVRGMSVGFLFESMFIVYTVNALSCINIARKRLCTYVWQ